MMKNLRAKKGAGRQATGSPSNSPGPPVVSVTVQPNLVAPPSPTSKSPRPQSPSKKKPAFDLPPPNEIVIDSKSLESEDDEENKLLEEPMIASIPQRVPDTNIINVIPP